MHDAVTLVIALTSAAVLVAVGCAAWFYLPDLLAARFERDALRQSAVGRAAQIVQLESQLIEQRRQYLRLEQEFADAIDSIPPDVPVARSALDRLLSGPPSRDSATARDASAVPASRDHETTDKLKK